uniref:Uncharacterized protein n=1 Tax=Anguilla anguilla TaxID=7936 RepID=A0A0E9Q8E7_ANGAN
MQQLLPPKLQGHRRLHCAGYRAVSHDYCLHLD